MNWEKIQEVTPRGAVSLFQVSLYLQVFPSGNWTVKSSSRGLLLIRSGARSLLFVDALKCKKD
jgi:hypothetical protein